MEMAEETLDTFWSLIDGIDICMMTTRDAGALRARPMTAKADKATHEFRFLTRQSTQKVDELAANPDVNLAFSDPKTGDYVSVSGQAYLTQDRKLIDQLWTASADAYFGCGKNDPDIAVIRVVPSKAEYWDARSTLRQAWNVFKAKDSDLEPELGANRKLALG
jgi:general stress protein 26